MPQISSEPSEPLRYRAVTRANVARTPQWDSIPRELRDAIMVVSTVLPFRTNEYVMRELIDWDRVPDDPIFQLTFVQRSMLEPADYATMASLVRADASRPELKQAADRIRLRMNPHPAGQLTHNVPQLHGRPLPGLQHKYRETVLLFPSQGQTCHAYCTFCFRWAQFVGLPDLKFQAQETRDLLEYLAVHPEVTDVLVTGGDPLVMRTEALRGYIDPLLDAGLEHLRHLRIGTKSVAYWPQRFVTDPDADALLRLFERVVASGRHLAIMGHYSHPRELSTPIAQEAVRRIRSTGAELRMQSPVIRHVNDDPDTWADLWRTGVRLGAVPYYMFVERDTGPKRYFELPLVRAWEVFAQAYAQVSGLCRTVRGPSMSAFPGKVLVDGVAEIHGESVLCLQFLQARDPSWVRRPFFAKFDPHATWLDQLTPAFGAEHFFFERGPTGVPRSPRRLAVVGG
ncbi:KamA family radical SAM protein [Paraliomyxa miuraensis]|uniref:KamA family radical SAM protein n=1 Tax=Paraliomyxa miuraensis TaxID=376150 RepID=UPI00225270AB|nr:lysine 2,3-aminomutase [Paraliomyxa miuraensis]MCX4244471.1 lysine 2,3-aminomutase [Paraliomyxa miuraensis]